MKSSRSPTTPVVDFMPKSGDFGLRLYPLLRLPEELHEAINEWLVVHIFNTDYPCMPIHKTICFCTREVYGIEISLIWPIQFVGRAAVFKLIAMKRIGLVEYLHQFGHDHIVERTDLVSTTSRFCPPVHFEGRLEQELCMFRLVVDHSAIPEKG